MIALSHLHGLSRETKRWVAAVFDILALAFSYFFAFSLRYEQIYWPQDKEPLFALLIAIPVSLVLFARFGLYRAVVRYMALSSLLVVSLGILSSAVVITVASWLLQATLPLSVVVSYALMSTLLVAGSRLLVRAAAEREGAAGKERVVIYGAGSAGRQLAQALINGAEYYPVCFVDDDETLHNSTMLGLPVSCPAQLIDVIKRYEATRILLAIPSASRARRREILEVVEPLPVTVQTIPGMADMVDGKMAIDELQDVKIEDLLGRDPVAPRKRLMDTNIRGKNVLVSGAGGSIGAELCRQIVLYQPRLLLLVEISEYNLYAIEKELQDLVLREELEVHLLPVLCSVQKKDRLRALMSRFKINTVYHAAAYKHVPMVEYNIVEGVRNNVFGTWHIAEAAVEAGVRDFVLISTDKAVRPTNVMGATKRFSELVLQGISKREGNQTHFSMVRFGNVLGSSGSVVPLFRQQILKGGPLTVTDPEITRYFMTIPEAAQLVIQAGAMGSLMAFESEKRETDCILSGESGQVFVLDMGEPVKIIDLARKLIRLMGLEVKSKENPDGDIEIVYSGLRPGEKLYEELLIGDNVTITDHPRIMTAREIDLPWAQVAELLQTLDTYCSQYEMEKIHALLCEAPLGFAPTSGINDVLWVAR